MTGNPLEAIRVVVVEPGREAWFLLGAVAGLFVALVVGTVLFWWERRR